MGTCLKFQEMPWPFYIGRMYYQIPGKYDIIKKMEIIHRQNGNMILSVCTTWDKFQGNTMLVQNDVLLSPSWT
jgi:hypothetical protein